MIKLMQLISSIYIMHEIIHFRSLAKFKKINNVKATSLFTHHYFYNDIKIEF